MRSMRAASSCLVRCACIVGLHGPDRAGRASPYAEPVSCHDHDAPYHLDAGDKLRVVVYGQEGLTNTYAVDASGSITMPLIGVVPARGRTPAGLASAIAAKLRSGYIRDPSVAVEIEPTGRSSSSARSPLPANIPMCRT